MINSVRLQGFAFFALFYSCWNSLPLSSLVWSQMMEKSFSPMSCTLGTRLCLVFLFELLNLDEGQFSRNSCVHRVGGWQSQVQHGSLLLRRRRVTSSEGLLNPGEKEVFSVAKSQSVLILFACGNCASSRTVVENIPIDHHKGNFDAFQHMSLRVSLHRTGPMCATVSRRSHFPNMDRIVFPLLWPHMILMFTSKSVAFQVLLYWWSFPLNTSLQFSAKHTGFLNVTHTELTHSCRTLRLGSICDHGAWWACTSVSNDFHIGDARSFFWRQRQHLTLHPMVEFLMSVQTTTARHPMGKPRQGERNLVNENQFGGLWAWCVPVHWCKRCGWGWKSFWPVSIHRKKHTKLLQANSIT